MVKAYLPPNKIGDHLDSVRQEGEKEAARQLNQLIIVCKDSVMYYDMIDLGNCPHGGVRLDWWLLQWKIITSLFIRGHTSDVSCD
jgi:hypothetical protein